MKGTRGGHSLRRLDGVQLKGTLVLMVSSSVHGLQTTWSVVACDTLCSSCHLNSHHLCVEAVIHLDAPFSFGHVHVCSRFVYLHHFFPCLLYSKPFFFFARLSPSPAPLSRFPRSHIHGAGRQGNTSRGHSILSLGFEGKDALVSQSRRL